MTHPSRLRVGGVLDRLAGSDHSSATMALTLVVHSTGGLPAQSVSFDAPRVVIGRSESSDLRLPDLGVSLRHATIRQRGPDYVIVDEGSTNGTFVGPVRLAPQAPRVLRSGDLIRIGRSWLEVKVQSLPITTSPTQATRELALALMARALEIAGEATVPRVTVQSGTDAEATLVLDEPERRYVVGRSANADLILGDRDASRRHLEVYRRGSMVMIRDLGSKNGTRLSDQPLPSGTELAWPSGAEVVIGTDCLTLDDPVRRALDDIDGGADEHLPDEGFPLPDDHGRSRAEVTVEKSVPVAKLGTSRRSRRRPARSTGISWADLMVGALALVMFGVSVFGLYWLLGGH